MAKTVPKETVDKFSVERLRKDCSKLFGVSISTYDGATHGLDGEYSIDEMKNNINNWLKKEVDE